MQKEFRVRDVFRLSSGVTVLACEGGNLEGGIAGRRATLVVHGETRQTIVLMGERHMLNQSANVDQRAFETSDVVELRDGEIGSGVRIVLLD